VTYALPNEWHGTDISEGKTSTQEYNGPAELAIYFDNESHKVMEVQDADNRTGIPVPADMYEGILNCDGSDEDCIRCIMIGPWSVTNQKKYELSVGPADQPNKVIRDPHHVYSVFDQNSVVEGWSGSKWGALTYDTGVTGDDFGQTADYNPGRDNWTDESVKQLRNEKLQASDFMTSEDMPDSIKAPIVEWRQKLRDMPADWAGVPPSLVVLPAEPGTFGDGADFLGQGAPDFEVVRIADRTAEDEAVIAAQFANVPAVN
jgi:hypothetical protein